MSSIKYTLLVLFFVANTAILCACSVFYSLDCVHIQGKCHQGAIYEDVIFVISAIFYGISCLISLVYYGRLYYRGPQSFASFMTSLTATNFVFALVAGICLLISLFFDFDPASLDDKYRKAHFILMWVVAGYAAVSNGLLLLLVLFFSYRHAHPSPKIKAPEIFVSPPDIQPAEIHKVPIV